MLFKIQHGIIDISPDFIQPNDHRTRGSQRLRQLQATNEAYRNSFYPLTISDWNRLPIHVTDLQTLQGFRVALASRYHDLPNRTGTKRTFVDTETDSLDTETDRNGPKRTFVNTETDSVGTESYFGVLK